jgi:hypothetical protein
VIRQKTDTYIKICMKTWLLCEASVRAELTSISPRQTLVKECSDCAKACFAVVNRLVSNAGDVGGLVLNCLLHCRQCSMECEKYHKEEDIQFCGIVSNICADSLKDIFKETAVFSLN